MEAHFFRAAIIAAAIGSMAASQRSANFIVTAATPEMAAQILGAAESYRRDLAIEWLGKAMPNWSAPCPIEVQVAPHLGAGGATSFLFENGEVYGWQMTIQGSLERVLDSVLPHEITHTIFATHFRRPLPRWADEGACTTVEHVSEKTKQQIMLVDFLRTSRGIPFSQMFAMKEYPRDVLPLYSQGYSLARYLIAQGGRRKFLDFLADGMRDENWTRAVERHYSISNLGTLQNAWLDWVRQGSPSLERPAAPLVASAATPGPAASPAGESGSIYRGQNSPAASPAPADSAPLARLVERDRSSAPAGEAGWRPARREFVANEPVIGAGAVGGPITSAVAGATNSAGPAANRVAANSDAANPDAENPDAANPDAANLPTALSGIAISGIANLVASQPAAPVSPVRAEAAPVHSPEPPVNYQATRQTPVQKSRQIILEWSRPPVISPGEPIRSSQRDLVNGGTTWR